MAKNNSELQGIRKKLVAAIAMVLVATIMVVSSSYAWFTLSTAPEVKGIQTAVGANGNLEMALRNIKEVNDITSTTTAGGSFPEANYYWGNLVDLSEGYHLSDIDLRPAGLNVEQVPGTGVTEYKKNDAGEYLTTVDDVETILWQHLSLENNDAVTESHLKDHGIVTSYVPARYRFVTPNDTGYLKTPEYGTDGRVSAIRANTTHGTYVENKGFVENKGAYGVRAIGTISGLSAEEIKLRDARLAVSSTAHNAKTDAQQSLSSDAIKIANIAIKHQMNDTATFAAEKADVQTAIDNLQLITADLEVALKKAIVAIGVSQGTTIAESNIGFAYDEDTKVTTITITGMDSDAMNVFWEGDATADPAIPAAPSGAKASLENAYAVIYSMNEKLSAAETKLASAGDAPTYNDMVNVVTEVLDPDDILINGMTVTELKNKGLPTMATTLTGNPTISITKGIYAEIAQFVENYSIGTSIRVDAEIADVGSIHDSFPVTMITVATEPAGGWYLTENISGWLANLTVSSATTEDKMISDLYAYMLDLAFRTNASGSNLLLQSAPANRVNDSNSTQGTGSYMEFTSGHIDFTVVQVGQLMENIRVVFMNDDYEIMAIAALEVFKDTGVIYDKDAGHLFKGENGNGMTWADGVTVNETTKTVRAMLYLYDFTVKTNDGTVTLDGKATSQDITALDQNVAKGVSTLVYLDGNNVENADVAISGDSMSGTMNLQFASSATLTPMDYTFQEKLAAPTIEIADGKLTITPAEGTTPEKYDIYVGSNKIENVTYTAPIDLTQYNSVQTSGQTVSISVVAKAADKANSDKSNVEEHTFPIYNAAP